MLKEAHHPDGNYTGWAEWSNMGGANPREFSGWRRPILAPQTRSSWNTSNSGWSCAPHCSLRRSRRRIVLVQTKQNRSQKKLTRYRLVKFVSRRSKERVTTERRNLLNRKPGELRPGRENDEARGEDHMDAVNGDTEQELPKVYITDDLTKARASLAYQTRVLKRSKRILDTWVINCKVMIKKSHGHISQVKSSRDLQNL